MANIKYIPVYLVGSPMLSTKYRYKGKPVNNIENNSENIYPYMLISVYHAMEKTNNFRQEYNISDNVFIFGDSGGFQNMTLGAKLEPLDVLRWQEKNCNAGFIFDNPIFQNDDKNIIETKQVATVNNAFIALNNRTTNMELIAVIQGHSPNFIDSCIDLYEQHGGLSKFDRISIGGLVPIAGNIDLLCKIVIYFIYKVKNYNKPIHFLGISNEKIIYILTYLSKLLDINITFDSSSPFSGARFGDYYLSLKQKVSYNDKNITKRVTTATPLLQQAIKDNEPLWLLGSLSTLHNLIVFEEEYQRINNMDLQELEKHIYPQHKHIIEMTLKYGGRYMRSIYPEVVNDSKQYSIYDF